MKTKAKTTIKEKKDQADEKQAKQFPGYPAYPDNEDITTNGKRISMDDEGNTISDADDQLLSSGNNDVIVGASNLTKEDLLALGPLDQSLDEGDDELLRQRKSRVDFSGKDLDIPGSELDDDTEELGSEDEENNLYSLGGDNHDNPEERQD